MSMDIYAEEGTKVRVLFNEKGIMNGSESDKEHAEKYLDKNTVYTIDSTDVHGWYTNVFLREFKNIYFNSVHFEEVDKEQALTPKDKLYELRRDAWTPSGFWRAGIKHTQAEWQREFNNDKLPMWNDWFIEESKIEEPDKSDELYQLVNDVFKNKGLYSISYKEAATEVAEIWLKQNQKP